MQFEHQVQDIVIQLEDIWKTYQTGEVSLTALKGIDLTIRRGEFAAIMGPSGSGKSTLMNVIGCLDQKDQGNYLLNGRSISELSANELAKIRNEEIGFVFQSFNLLSKLNLRENVELPMVYAGIGRKARTERAMAALEAVGLADWARHKPNEVSGGQKQRAAIARAIALKPALIMADEPTGNLDSKSSHEIMQLFATLNEEGTTILLITHEADVAAYARRIIRFGDGRIVDDPMKRGAVDVF
ncbi:MAG: putative transport system ATP-binding protein [Clostridiales bacterium]|jgi:putative ABC transport system ATP-binding protein|nr:putative transport system ATP-binding protein [Clostridiales bacterium]